MEKTVYLKPLDCLTEEMEGVPNTWMGMTFKVLTLAILNMRYERIALDHASQRHPYERVRDLVEEQRVFFRAAVDALFIENTGGAPARTGKRAGLEGLHQDLFNAIWDQYDAPAYDAYVDRYTRRLRVNRLEELVVGKKCLDLGCGNGNFCFALAALGGRKSSASRRARPPVRRVPGAGFVTARAGRPPCV
ncbi:MAG: hypothetical protein IPP68_00115 [Elusimicrobia bacterium]|nr:hypothetical protein [Elusimicrobiota bacterium]